MITRLAVTSDLPLIVRWRHEAAQWLASLGSDQWSDAGLSDQAFEKRVRESISAGETWVADMDGQPVGAIAIDEWTDNGLWTAEERANALFIHRMIIAREVTGRSIGAALLDHAKEVARDRGKQWLRLDAWTTNLGLHQYYRDQGFTHVRTISEHPSPSAALFEYAVFDELPSDIRRTLIELGELDHGNPTPPDHWHQVRGVRVVAPYAFLAEGRPLEAEGPLEMSPNSLPLYVWHDDEQWLISDVSPSARHNTLAKRVLSWDSGPALNPSERYVIKHQGTERRCRLILHRIDTPQNNPHKEARVRKTP